MPPFKVPAPGSARAAASTATAPASLPGESQRGLGVLSGAGHSLSRVSVSPPSPPPASGSGVIQAKLTIPVASDEDFVRHRNAIRGLVRGHNEDLDDRDDNRFDFSSNWFSEGGELQIDYSAQHLADQYPQVAGYLAREFEINVDHRSQLAGETERRYGGFFARRSAAQIEERHGELLGRGIQAVNQFDLQPFHEGQGNEPARHHFSAEAEHGSREAPWLEGALEHSPGLVLGESHAEDTHRDFLASKLGRLKEAGVNTIYLEAIRSDYQAHVDRYLNGGPEARMSPELYRFLRNKGGDGVNYLELMRRIKAEGGLRVVGIDAPEATTRYREDVGDREMAREITMNQFAMETIRGDAARRGQHGKYVILTGAAHATAQPQRENALGVNRRVPGFSEMLGIPAVSLDRAGPVQEEPEPEHLPLVGLGEAPPLLQEGPPQQLQEGPPPPLHGGPPQVQGIPPPVLTDEVVHKLDGGHHD